MSKITLIISNIDKTELAECIKQQMISDGYPEEDLKDFENIMEEHDIAQRLLHGLVDSKDIEIED
jgi:hypothetical protein